MLVAAAVTFVANLEVRKQARAAAAARLAIVADRLMSSTGSSVPRILDQVSRVAADPGVVQALRGSGADTTAARAAMSRLVGGNDSNTVVVLWDLARQPIVAAYVNDDTAGWMGSPELVDTVEVLPIGVTSDSIIYYDLVAPVHDGPRLTGFLQRRTRVLPNPQTAATVVALLGAEGKLLFGSRGGTWTTLGRAIDPPAPEVLDASEVVSYHRDSATQLGLSRAVTGTPWLLVAEIPERAALSVAEGFLGRVGLLALALGLVATAAAWLLGRGITQPLRSLTAATDAIRNGDLTARVPVIGHPELTQVAEHFNEMADESARHIAAVEAKEQRFRSLVTATAQIVWWTDADGQVRDAIPSWQAFTGQSIEELRGTGWTRAVHPEDAGRAMRIWNEAIEHRSLYETEYRLRRHDGEFRWFLARAVPVLGPDGEIAEWVGTYTDTTRRHEAEERLQRKEEELRQAQRLDAIGRLAGGVAHDFNNLLTAIVVPADLAKQRLEADHEVQRDLDEIREAGLRASELTRQLLAFGRQQVLAPEIVQLDSVVSDASRMLKRVLPESVTLELGLNGRGGLVRVDRTQIDQVLVNLAVNARDAMPNGGRLTIESQSTILSREFCERHEGIEPGRYLMLAVTDTGVGMNADVLSQVFEPFFTTKPVGQGTGLGLSTVYGIVRQSGGHIWIYSEEGKGTSVKVYFPEAEGVVATDPREVEMGDSVPSGTGIVLLAEDDAALRRVGERLLGMLGYTVLTASRGEEALEVARAHAGPIDLLLTDVVMPGMNGMELWVALRRERPGIPALFLSGWASDAVVRHQILEGDVPFLQKPFTMDSLGRKLREVMGRGDS